MILEACRKIVEKRYYLTDNLSKFYIFHVPTNRILRSGIIGYENTKKVASAIRKQYGYKFDDVRMKKERNQQQQSKSNQGQSGYNRNPSKRGGIYRYQTSKGHWKDWDE